MEKGIAQPDMGVTSAANGGPEAQSNFTRNLAEFEAKWKAEGARIATENGFRTFEEYEKARSPIRRAERLAGARPISEEQEALGLDPRKALVSSNPETHKLRYNPEKCFCTGLSPHKHLYTPQC